MDDYTPSEPDKLFPNSALLKRLQKNTFIKQLIKTERKYFLDNTCN